MRARERHRLVDADGHADGPVDADQPGRPGSRASRIAHRPVSCPSPTFCAFVDNTGHTYELADGRLAGLAVVRDAGRSGAPVSLYQPGRVGVSCPTPSACMAVVGASVLDWNGSSWAEESAPWTSSLASGRIRRHRHLLPHHLVVRHRQRHRGVDGRPRRPVVERRDARPGRAARLDLVPLRHLLPGCGRERLGGHVERGGLELAGPGDPVGRRVPGRRARPCPARTPSSAWSSTGTATTPPIRGRRPRRDGGPRPSVTACTARPGRRPYANCGWWP